MKTQLELCKLFAELEFDYSEVRRDRNGGYVVVSDCRDFNPITDLALTMKAMIDYKVDINHEFECAEMQVGPEILAKIGDDECYAMFNSKEDIPRAVIECILKSEGLI